MLHMEAVDLDLHMGFSHETSPWQSNDLVLVIDIFLVIKYGHSKYEHLVLISIELWTVKCIEIVIQEHWWMTLKVRTLEYISFFVLQVVQNTLWLNYVIKQW